LWSNLLRRVTEAYRQVTAEMELGKGWQDKESNEFVEASMRSMYRQLRKNIVGSPRHLNG
jgi:hypothetical protein